MLLPLLLLLSQIATPAPENSDPAWVEQPQAVERTIFANFIGLAGKVNLDCGVSTTGLLENCVVRSAVPEGAGFERVALQGTTTGRLTPRMVAGRPTAARVSFAMNFARPAPFPPFNGPEPSAEAIALAGPLAEFIATGANSGRIVADVAPDRQVLVQSWIDDLLPVDQAADARRIALQYARTLSLQQLRNIHEGRQPGGEMPDFVTLNAAQDPDPRLIHAGQELRRRYCAAFDCTDPFPDQ